MNTLNLKYASFAAMFVVASAMGIACGDDETGSGGSGNTGNTGNNGGTTNTGGDPGTGGMATGGMGTGGTMELPLDCATYCGTITAACTGDNSQYVSNDNCLAVCDSFVAGTNGTGAPATGENTLGCRIYHASVASTGATEADTHCTHAGPGGYGQCGDTCESFCQLNLAICTGNDEVFADEAACLAACQQFDATDVYSSADAGPTNGEDYSCHLYHLTAAAEAPGTHCPHTDLSGGPCD
jgi:hypothetical protein